MQEIALILSSFAGLATAAALRKMPRGKKPILTLAANSQIKSQINSLNIEKEILSRAISRLYQNQSGLSKIQQDRLLIRYQHQLGIVLAKMEKLQEASKHPDLGPVGDGLIALMDQKLSQLDKRLYELSSKISVSNTQVHEQKPKSQDQIKKEKIPSTPQIQKEVSKEITKPQDTFPTQSKSVEITTLTELPTKISEFPFIEQKPSTVDFVREQIEKPQPNVDEKIEILQSSMGTAIDKPLDVDIPKQESILPPVQKPKPTIKLPEEEKIEDEDDNLDKIKGEIMKTLSKLEQAEVE